MPYRSAYLWTILLGLLTIPAFWRGYFSRLADSPFAMHFHAATATLWMVLLAGQAWSAHRKGRIDLHRQFGRLSLYYFPIFTAGSMLIIWSMAYNTAFGDSIIYEAHGEGLGAFDIIGTLAICWFYYEALKARRDVHVHARFMLGTLFVLFGPIVARLVAIPLFISMRDTQAPSDLFFAALMITQALIIAIALSLYFVAPAKGKRPCAAIAVITVMLTIGFVLGRLSDAWREIFMAIGGTPPLIWAVLGFALGAAASYLGWQKGKTASGNAIPNAAQPAP